MDKTEIQNNPLAVPQRETVGAETFGKYDYQYHWALLRVLDAHEKYCGDYVVFIELHEDVIFSTSTDSINARFEFNQIKNLSKKLSLNDLISSSNKKSNKKDEKTLDSKSQENILDVDESHSSDEKKGKSSILGKMLIGIHQKTFADKIDELNLVTTGGFTLPKEDGIKDAEKFNINDLGNEVLYKIQSAIRIELKIDTYEIPKTLNFIQSKNLPTVGFAKFSIGAISELVDKKYKKAKCNATDIYRTLIDDLHRKGQVTSNYKEWKDAIANKGLTGIMVDGVISANMENNDLKKNKDMYFSDIQKELGFPISKRMRADKVFDIYYNKTRLDRGLAIYEIRIEIEKIVSAKKEEFFDKGIEVIEELANTIKQSNYYRNLLDVIYNDEVVVEAAICCELFDGKMYEK